MVIDLKDEPFSPVLLNQALTKYRRDTGHLPRVLVLGAQQRSDMEFWTWTGDDGTFKEFLRIDIFWFSNLVMKVRRNLGENWFELLDS